MALGQINIIQENTGSGGINEVERTVLFIGHGDAAALSDQLHSISNETDLDAILGSAYSDLKANIAAARDNAGSNFTAWVIPLAVEGMTADQALDMAIGSPHFIYPEIVALTDVVTSAAEVGVLQTLANSSIAAYGKYGTVHAAVAGIAGGQTWAQYMTQVKAINNAVVASRVALVPQLQGINLGVVVGRLCNSNISIADSPMRVRTGAVSGIDMSMMPIDSAGVPLDIGHIQELATARFSVPQWYSNFAGIYWADHPMLDAEGGDFQVFENVRVLDYVTRRVRVLMIRKIADRSLNSSKSSTAFHEQYFMQPIFDAAKGSVINGEAKPGMVQKPKDGDIQIVWVNSNAVELSITVAPVNAPKSITTRIALDLARLGE